MADKQSSVPVLLPLIILFNISLSSCHLVKENRDHCPCRLEIRLTGTRGDQSNIVVNTDMKSWEYYATGDTVISVFVPRGKVSVIAWSGASEPVDGAFMGTAGSGFPPLYLCHCSLNADGEEVIAHANLRKQFCTLNIGIDGPPGWGRPFGTTVRGSAYGMDIYGLPLEGPFNCNLGDSTDTWSLRLPRQSPESPLLLDIVMADSVIRTFSLGSYLLESGFDWSSPDLPDLDLRLNLSVTTLTLHSPSWQSEVAMSVQI